MIKRKPSVHVSSSGRRRFIKGSLAAAAGAGLGRGRTLFGREALTDAAAPRIKRFRPLGRTGFQVSDVSFGAAELADAALLEAILDAGVNYIDTSSIYRNGGSERVIGRVIRNRDRKKLFLTTKLKVRMGDTRRTLIDQAEKCLERLRTEYVDCLMIHGPSTLADLNSEAFHSAFEDLQNRGRVRFRGVSHHGAQWGDVRVGMEPILLAAAADGRFDVLLLVYNFLQHEKGDRILEACRRNRIGAALMKTNPVLNFQERQEEAEAAARAGRELPERRKNQLRYLRQRAARADSFKKRYELSDYDDVRSAAVRFALSSPLVSCACITIKNFSDLEFYTALSGRRFDSRARNALALYSEAMGRFTCRHACGDCESACPLGVPVNTIMRYDFYFRGQGREKTAMRAYAELPTRNAGACRTCAGSCQEACPHGVPVHRLLAAAHERLTLA